MTAKILKPLAKLGFTALLLYFVFDKIDLNSTLERVSTIHPLALLLAFALFNASQFLSTARLNRFLASISIPLRYLPSLKLYYLGMFYNLFLPGGIGGDGYKAWLLNRRFETGIKPIIQALLVDRLSGLLGLGILLCLFAPLWFFTSVHGFWLYLIPFLVLPGLLTYHFIVKQWFSPFYSTPQVTYYSLGIQGFQLLSVLILVLALNTENPLPYLGVFLISSVATILPLTIGGFGAREITFLYLSTWIQLDSQLGVAISLLFFTITACSSLLGLIFISQKTI